MVAVETVMRVGTRVRPLAPAVILAAFMVVASACKTVIAGTWHIYPSDSSQWSSSSVIDDRHGGIWFEACKNYGEAYYLCHIGPDRTPALVDWPGRMPGVLVCVDQDLILTNDAEGIWRYRGQHWDRIAHRDQIRTSRPEESLVWGWSSSDGRWCAIGRYFLGQPFPEFFSEFYQKLSGEWTCIGLSGFQNSRFGRNDGAIWAYSYSQLVRANWGGTLSSLPQCTDYHDAVVTQEGTLLCMYYASQDVLTEISLKRGVISETTAHADEQIFFVGQNRLSSLFGRDIYVTGHRRDESRDYLHRISPAAGGWQIVETIPSPEYDEPSNPYVSRGLVAGRDAIDSAGNYWVIDYWNRCVAVYDRSDELIEPTITLTVGLDVIEPQDTTVVNASIAPGQRTYNADVYAVVQTPSGELWSYPWTEQGIHPMAENLHFDPQTFVSDFILLHIEPPMPIAFARDGQYTVYAALTEPGTLNPIGEIASVPFELALGQ